MSNSALNNAINYATFVATQLVSSPFTSKKNSMQEPPLLVSGIFRSGTTITTRVLAAAGFDTGPAYAQMQSQGPLAKLNPDGFYEDFFFMQLSLYLFHLTHSWGDRPPDEAQVASLNGNVLSDQQFRKYAFMQIHDDRVSNLNKLRTLRNASVNHPLAYVSHCFGKRPLIKNPHFSVLEPFFMPLFPQSQRVVVFRHPAAWERSALDVTKNVNATLYDRYYRYYIAHPEHAVFFDYDRLLAAPEYSIRQLLQAVHAKADVQALLQLIRPSAKSESSKHASQLYPQLLKLAINA